MNENPIFLLLFFLTKIIIYYHVPNFVILVSYQGSTLSIARLPGAGQT